MTSPPVPTVVVVSFWRNDSDRNLDRRMAHLLAKEWPQGMRLRWLWVVGDSTDDTFDRLITSHRHGFMIPLDVMKADTGIVGDDTPSRRRRMAATATQAFAAIREDDWAVLLHESDLRTPIDIVDRFCRTDRSVRGGYPVAGWPTLGEGGVFYDQWAYRHLDGRHFMAEEPRPDQLIEVASFGSCWFAAATLVRNRTLGEDCVVDLCRQWKAEGVHLWVDPTIPVVQPVELWTPTAF